MSTTTTKKKSGVHTSDYAVSKYGTDKDPTPHGTPILRKKLKIIEWTSNGEKKETSMEDYAVLQRLKNLQVPDNKTIHVKEDGLIVKKKGTTRGSLVVTFVEFQRSRERKAQSDKKYKQSDKGQIAAAKKNKNRRGRRIQLEITVPESVTLSQKQELDQLAAMKRDSSQLYINAALMSEQQLQQGTKETLLAMKQQDDETLRTSIATLLQRRSLNGGNVGRYAVSDDHSKDGSEDLPSGESDDLESEEEPDGSESEYESEESESDDESDVSVSDEESKDSKKRSRTEDSNSINNTSRTPEEGTTAVDGGRHDDRTTFKETEGRKYIDVGGERGGAAGTGKNSDDRRCHDSHVMEQTEGREYNTTSGERVGEDVHCTDASNVDKVENEEPAANCPRLFLTTASSFLNVPPIHPNGESHDFNGTQIYLTEHCKVRCYERNIRLSELKNALQHGHEETNSRHFEDVSHHGETRMFVCGFVTVITNVDKTTVVTACRDPPSLHAEMQKPEVDVNRHGEEPLEVTFQRIRCQADDREYYHSCKEVVDRKAAKLQEQRAEDLAYHDGERYGYQDGRRDGYREGRRDGYDDGHANGYQEGREDEWNDLHPRPSQRCRR